MAPLGPRVPVVLLFLLVAAKIAVSEPQACYGMNTTDQILAYDASEIHTISRGWQRSNVSDQDDGCFDRQRLPFAFPWYNMYFYNLGERIWVGEKRVVAVLQHGTV
eukprot:1353049-Amorphochlora_amoeboformis.AAC.1